MKPGVLYWNNLYAIQLNNKIKISKYKSNITRKIRENMYNNISLSSGLVDNDERVDENH